MGTISKSDNSLHKVIGLRLKTEVFKELDDLARPPAVIRPECLYLLLENYPRHH